MTYFYIRRKKIERRKKNAGMCQDYYRGVRYTLKKKSKTVFRKNDLTSY